MYLYNYILNGVSKSCYIAFDKEEDIIDSFKAVASKLSNPSKDIAGQYYLYCNGSLTSGGTIQMTRDVNAQPVWKTESAGIGYDQIRYNYDIEIGNGWNIPMPQIKKSETYYVNDDTKRIYCTFKSETGEILDFYYTVFRSGSQYPWVVEDNEQINKSNYTINTYTDNQSHNLGFNYNISAANSSGKTYYFCIEDITSGGSVLPVAVADKYNNAMYYTALSSNSVKITDSMGREVVVSESGINVTKGSSTKSISYIKSYESTTRDPNNVLNCINTNTLTVCKNQDNVQEKTVYYTKNKSIVFHQQGQTEYQSKLIKILYPTNAYTTYEYEETPTILKNAVGSTLTSQDYKEYHITKKSIYENNALKHYIGYSFKFGTGTQKKRKTLCAAEIMPNSKTKQMEYKFDDYGRMLSEIESYKTGNGLFIPKIKKEYSYSDKFYNQTDLSALNMRSVMRAYLSGTKTYYEGKLVSANDVKYDEKYRLLHSQQGESSVDNTYDDTYGVLLTSETKKDIDTTVKTVNTLTSDKKSIASTKTYENGVLKNTVLYSYNADGTVSQKAEASDEYGNITTTYAYTYNTDGSYKVTGTVKNVTDADGNKKDIQTVQQYDWQGRLCSETDGNGNTTLYQYDNANRITKATNPDGTYKTISYNISQNSVTVTDENGYVTTKDYTPLGQPEKVYINNNPNSVLGSYTYDKLDRVTSMTAYKELGGTAVTESYTYDDLGRVTTQTGTSGSETLDTVSYSYAYDNSFTKFTPNSTADVSEYDKAIVVIDSGDGTLSKTNDVRIYTDNTQVHYEIMYKNWQKTAVIDLRNKSSLRITATSTSTDLYIKYCGAEDEESVLGGDTQTVTAEYTGDSTYVNPTEVKKIDGFGNTISETYYQPGTSTVLNKNTYKYDYSGNVVETNGGSNLLENLSDYVTKTEYDYMGNPVKVYRTKRRYIMKKDVLNSLAALAITIVVGVCIVFCVNFFDNQTMVKDYFSVLGMEDFSLEYFEKLLAKIPDESIIELDSTSLQVRQDGYDIFLHKNLNEKAVYPYGFMRLEVYNSKYKFEHDKISIGTSREIVENTYKKYSEIKDLPNNQIGYIIDDFWIRFELDENNVVDKIVLFYGP